MTYSNLLNKPDTNKRQANGKKKPLKTATLTPAKKKFAEVYAETDNGAEAIRRAYPELKNSSVQSVSTKAGRLLKNAEVFNHVEYQKNKLEQLATKAVQRVESLIQSDNEMVASTNVWKTIEQVQGKAVQKSTNINYNFTQHAEDKGSGYGV